MTSVPQIPRRPMDTLDRAEATMRDIFREIAAANDGVLELRPLIERLYLSYEAVASAEREACAQIAAGALMDLAWQDAERIVKSIAADIRARTQDHPGGGT